jgi:hypothetical protein
MLNRFSTIDGYQTDSADLAYMQDSSSDDIRSLLDYRLIERLIIERIECDLKREKEHCDPDALYICLCPRSVYEEVKKLLLPDDEIWTYFERVLGIGGIAIVRGGMICETFATSM